MANGQGQEGPGTPHEREDRSINAPTVAPEMDEALRAQLPGLGETQRQIAEGARTDPTYEYQGPRATAGRGHGGSGERPESLSEYIMNFQATQNPELTALYAHQDRPMTQYDWQMTGVNEQLNRYHQNLAERGGQLSTLNQQGAYQPAMTNIMSGIAGLSNPFAAQQAGLREQMASGRQRQMASAMAQQRLQSGTGMDAMQQARLRMQMDQAQRTAQADLQQKQNEQRMQQYTEAGNIAAKAQQLMNQRQGQAAQYSLGTLPEAFDFSLLSTPPTEEQRRANLAGMPWLGSRLPESEFFQSLGFNPLGVHNQRAGQDRFFTLASGGAQGQPLPEGNVRQSPEQIIAAWRNRQGF